MKKGIGKKGVALLLVCTLFFTSGCSILEKKEEKVKDLEFTIQGEEKLGDELKQIVEERKQQPFKVTYSDQEYLYICVGYGEQDSGGYSVVVNELYLTENAIYVNTSLLGPSSQDEQGSGTSYPYLVIKTEFIDLPVVFE